MTKSEPRFTVAVQSEDDPCCYKHAYQSNKLGQARQKAQALHEETGRVCIISDKEDWNQNWEYIGLPPAPAEEDDKPVGKISKKKAPARKRKKK